MSWRTWRVALAVKAAMGLAGKWRRRLQLPVLGAELVAPFGDAMGFVDCEERDGDGLQPADGILARQAFRGEIEQAVGARARVADDVGLFGGRHGAVQDGGRDAHLGELGGLILHERNQGRDYDGGSAEHEGGELVAERFSAAGGHDDADVAAVEKAAYDALLHRAKRVVTPVAAQGFQ